MKALDVVFPYKGVVSDLPPSETGEATASVIENAIVTPTEIRPRLGVRAGPLYGSAGFHEYPAAVGVVNGVLGAYMCGPVHDQSTGVPVLELPPPDTFSGTGYGELSFPATTAQTDIATARFVTIDLDGNVRTSTGIDSVFNGFGHAVTVGGTAWWHGFPAVTNITGPGVCGWGGTTGPIYVPSPVTSTAAAVAVGSRTVTLAAPVVSFGVDVINRYMVVPGGSGAASYAYRIVSFSGSTITLAEPYGMGDPSAVALASGATIHLNAFCTQYPPQFTSTYPTPGVTAVASWRGRLFCGSSATSMVAWSYPGNPFRWPEANWALFDEIQGRPITGLGSCSGGLLIFTKTDVGLLSGFDESSFQFRVLTSNVGCAAPISVTSHAGVVYWDSGNGIYSSDGRSVTNISSVTTSGHRRHDRNVPTNGGVPGSRATFDAVHLTVHADRLFATRNIGGSVAFTDTSTAPVWVCDLQNGAWSTMTVGPGGGWTPQIFQVFNGKLLGFTGKWVMDATYSYLPWHPWQNTPMMDHDTGYNVDDERDSTKVETTVTFTVRPGGRDTVRLREAEIAHSTYYGGLVSEPRDGWYMDVTPDYSTQTTTNTVRSRFVANAQLFDPHLYYSDKLTNVADGEGTVFRVTLRTNSTHQFTSNHFSRRLIGVRIYFDPSATHAGRVNTNPIY